jgi:aspartyl/asparaginyl-tRNA synthetase
MQNLREMILEKPAHVLSIIETEKFRSSFALMGEQYVKKYTIADIPASMAALYRMKNVYAEHSIDNMDLLFSRELLDQIIDGFQALSAFYALLRSCMIRKDLGG